MSSEWTLIEIVGRVGLFRASCPPPLQGHLPSVDVQIRSRRISQSYDNRIKIGHSAMHFLTTWSPLLAEREDKLH
jgi:hypothetical protein